MILTPTQKQLKPNAPFITESPPKEPEEKHIHEYERSKTNKNVYRCVAPDCSHYHSREYLLGKRARCGKCKEPFLLDRFQLINKIPVCSRCTRSKKGKKIQRIKNILEGIL